MIDVTTFPGTTFTAQLQNACDNATEGSTLLIPAGAWTITQTISITRKVSILMEAGYINFNSPSSIGYVFEINVESSGYEDNRAQFFSGIRGFITNGFKGVFNLQNTLPNIANNGVIFENLVVTGVDSGLNPSNTSDYVIRIDGFGTHGTIIQNCGSITGGIGLFCSDSTRIVDNMFGGNNVCIYLKLSDGAFGTLIKGNASKTKNGFLWCDYASNVLCESNHIEQEGQNTSTFRASCTFSGFDANHVSRGWKMIGNNFGGGSFVDYPLHFEENVEDFFLDYNTYYPGGTFADINIASSTVRYVRVGRNNTLRGARAGVDPYNNGVVPAGTFNSSNGRDSGQLLVVNDAGIGTYEDIKAPALSNGWTADSRAIFTASISGTTMTVSALPSTPDYIRTGTFIFGAGVAAGTTVIGWNGDNTYRIDISQAVASTSMTSRHILFWKGADDILRFSGTLASGTVTPGTVIFTLPIGFRPSVDRFLRIYNQNTGTDQTLYVVASSGEVQTYSVNSPALLHLDLLSFPIQGHQNYVSGW